MFKTIMGYSLPPGTDPDEFWKWHTQVHGHDIKTSGAKVIKKYVINRVVDVLAGEPGFFGLVEIWWESEEAWRKEQERVKNTPAASGTNIYDDFFSRAKLEFRIHAEEYVEK